MTETVVDRKSGRETLRDGHVVDADVHIHDDPAARQLLFPDHLLYLAMVRDPDFAVTLASSYNQWRRTTLRKPRTVSAEPLQIR